jgi:hypothetical protein
VSSRLSHLIGLEPPADMVKRQYRPTNPDKRKYLVHRTNAKMRGVEFKLTFEEWFCWWMDTGHYSERGREVGKYVMARKGDVGAYELGNIECVQAQVNSVAAHLGKTRSDEIKANMSEAQKTRHAKKRLTKRTALNHGIKS